MSVMSRLSVRMDTLFELLSVSPCNIYSRNFILVLCNIQTLQTVGWGIISLKDVILKKGEVRQLAIPEVLPHCIQKSASVVI